MYQEARTHRADLSLDLRQQQADQFNYFNAYYPSTPFVSALVSVPLFNGNSNKA